MGDDEQGEPGRAGGSVGAPKPDRIVAGAPPGDERPEALPRAGEDLAVALVLCEEPLVESFAAVTHRLLRTTV